MKTALCITSWLLALSCAAAQEYVHSKSYPHSPDEVFHAATRTFAAMNANIEQNDTSHHTIRVRFDRNGAGYRGANLTADYAVFSVTADPAKKGYTRAELRLGHAPLSSMPNMSDSISHSPIPGAKYVNVRDKSAADAFFRKLKKALGP